MRNLGEKLIFFSPLSVVYFHFTMVIRERNYPFVGNIGEGPVRCMDRQFILHGCGEFEVVYLDCFACISFLSFFFFCSNIYGVFHLNMISFVSTIEILM